MAAEDTLPPDRRSTAARRAIALAMVLTVALAVRVYAAGHAQNIARDAPIYLTMAHQLGQDPLSDVIHRFQYHPGYGAMIATVARVTGAAWPDGWVAAGRGISIAMSLLALAMLYLFARKAFEPGVALVTVLLFGMTETFIEVSSDVLSDAPAVAMLMCSVVMGLKSRESLDRGSWAAAWWAAGAGAAAGLGYLIRPEELLGALLCATVLAWPAKGRRRSIQATSLAAVVAATLVFVLPYALAIGALTQKKSLSDFAMATGSGAGMLASVSGWPIALLEALRRTLDRSRDMLSTPLTLLAGICLVTWIGRYVFRIRPPEGVVMTVARPAGMMMAGATAVMFALMASLEFHHSRYISSRHALPMVLLLAPCAGAGLFTLVQWSNWLLGRLAQARPAWRIAAYLAARPAAATYVWLIVFVSAVGANAMTVPHADKGCYRQIGREIRLIFGDGRRVIATDTLPPFYAGSPADEFEISPSRLEGSDLDSPDTVFRRAIEGKFEFVVLPVTPSGKRHQDSLRRTSQLVEAVLKDVRFELISASQSQGQAAWLFRVRSPDLMHGATAPKVYKDEND